MNKIFITSSIVLTFIFFNLGITAKAHLDEFKSEQSQLESNNADLKQMIRKKESLLKKPPVPITAEYSNVLNQIRLLESYSGTSMRVQLEGASDSQDISEHFVDTEYRGIKGLKIRLLVDKLSKEMNMGAILDDIHLLEMDTDFVTSEIIKENNNLIVKGEIYGL